MAGFGDVIKYLYEKFILRDVLSFVTPGAIIVLTSFVLLKEPSLNEFLKYSSDMHWLLYIPLFGLFFTVGFAVQCLGELFDIIRFTPDVRGSWSQRWKIFLRNWADRSNIWWTEEHKDLVDFIEKTQGDEKEWARQQHERLVILKQLCANGFLSIAIAGVLLLVNHWHHQASLVLSFVVTFLLIASLLWGYRVHLLKQDTIAKAIRHSL